jgi:hypothetical protein
VVEIQVLEPGSSPTSGTVFPQVRSLLVYFRVHIVHTPASDLMFRVCGSRIDLFGCGGLADYGGPRTALWGLFWVFILVRPSVGFRVHHFMVARIAYNMTCRMFFRSGSC